MSCATAPPAGAAAPPPPASAAPSGAAVPSPPSRFQPPTWAKPPLAGRAPVLDVYENGELKRTVRLDGRALVLGRCAPADLVLEEPSVSRIHAALLNSATATFILDLDSAQGTFVGDESVAALPQLGVRAEAGRAIELKENATVRLGASRVALKVHGLTPPELERWSVPAWCTLPTRYTDLHGGPEGSGQHRKDLSNVRGVVLGRSERFVDVAVPHESVSRLHAAIVHDEDTTFVVDLGSAHGTFVNSVRCDVGVHTKCADGSQIALGSCPFAFTLRVGAAQPGRANDQVEQSKRPRKS